MGYSMANIADKLQAVLRFRRGNRILLAVFLLLVISVVIIGLDDIPGFILGYVATSTLFLMMTRKWNSIKRFLLLLTLSIIGIIFLSFLYVEVISRIAVFIAGDDALQNTAVRIIETIITYIILFGGPVGMFFGFAGTVILGIFRLLPSNSENSPAGNT
jgi:hypothetical protein